MKTLGMIGGLSWESTAHYYTRLNQLVAERLGGLHSADLLLHSLDFDTVQKLQHTDRWDELATQFVDVGRRLEGAGAQGLLIGANTMHILAPQLAAALSIPILHVADALADAATGAGVSTLALLGTRFTMEKPFYRERLEKRGLKVLIPDEAERTELHRIIYAELCRGIVNPESKDSLYRIVARLQHAGARGVALACTEFSLLVDASRSGPPLFDTTELHARTAVHWMLGPGP